jgi:hypothetical protein
MPMVVPNTVEVAALTTILTPALTLRIYGNNATPTGASTAASFTEISGGGYVAKPLTFANWGIVAGDPSVATYNAMQDFNFTGAIAGPGTIYGYFVTRNSDGLLQWAERFPVANVPFVPIAGSKIQILPKFTAQSLF